MSCVHQSGVIGTKLLIVTVRVSEAPVHQWGVTGTTLLIVTVAVAGDSELSARLLMLSRFLISWCLDFGVHSSNFRDNASEGMPPAAGRILAMTLRWRSCLSRTSESKRATLAKSD